MGRNGLHHFKDMPHIFSFNGDNQRNGIAPGFYGFGLFKKKLRPSYQSLEFFFGYSHG